MAALRRHGRPGDTASLTRFGITAAKALFVPVGTIRAIARDLGPDQALAEALWDTGWYEARLLAAFVGEPERVTVALMDRWARDFDNWGVCDTVCFHLFDRVPRAWGRIGAWATRPEEFVKRAAFALLACLALHDRERPEAAFASALPLCERAATDDRHLVKKAVSWALRAIGRRSGALRQATLDTARRLAASDDTAARWVGRDVLRDLGRASTAAQTGRRLTRATRA
jgi:3-methyladenine DNA glycosylase AlkD